MQRSRVVAVALVVGVLLVFGLLVWRQSSSHPAPSTAVGMRRTPASTPRTTPSEATPTDRQSTPPRAAVWPSPRVTRGTTPAPRAPRYTFPIAGCETQYATAHHDYPATDVFAPRGCLFVSPVAGVVDEVNRVDHWDPSTNVGADRGGLSVSVVGEDGVRYYGSHLEAVRARIRPGTRVGPGTPLGRIGDSGSARGVGTHLHFGISWPTPPGRWWIRRGAVAPAQYLDAWQAGRDLSPAPAVATARRAYGDDSRCHAYC